MRQAEAGYHMNKRVMLGVSGGLLLAIGLALGIVLGPSLQALAAGSHASAAKAATPSATTYCQLYEQTVSKDLGVSQSQLESANKDALQAVINKMYADGKLTQAQKAQAEQELSQYASNPCAAIQAAAQQKGKWSASGQPQAVSAARSTIIAAVAGALNMPTSALQSELSGGKTVAQIITEKGANTSAVNAAYLKAVQSELAKAVSSGALTQAQSDMASSAIQQMVASGHYPLLDANGAYGAMLPASMMSGQ